MLDATRPVPPHAHGRRAGRVVLAGLILVGAAASAEVPGADPGARTFSLVVSVNRKGSVQHVRARLTVEAPAATCYEVLADFDDLEEFVPGLRSSDVLSAPGEPVLLHQVGEAKVAFFRTTLDVTLAVREQPPVRIEFERVAGNLKQMRGHWAVAGDAHHCVVDYQAEVQPAFWVPPLIGPRLMRTQVERQLAGVLAEIRARAPGRPAP